MVTILRLISLTLVFQGLRNIGVVHFREEMNMAGNQKRYDETLKVKTVGETRNVQR